MITHIHHINFVVADLSRSIDYFCALLNQAPTIEELPMRNATSASFRIGESFLVLVQPLSDEGVIADILANKGEGIFLLSFGTDSIDTCLASLETTVAQPHSTQKRQGIHKWSVCDIASAAQFGAILQLTKSCKINS